MNKNEMLSATSLCCSFDNVELTTVDGINILGLSNINESAKDHYIVYKILNHVNGRYYIGQHRTHRPLDSYMGSGKLIRAAIQKYSISCFSKEVLYDFNTFEEMNQKEKELVPLSACYPNNPLSYNLQEGGQITVNLHDKLSHSHKGKIPHNKGKHTSLEIRRKISANRKGKCVGKDNPNYGKPRTLEQRLHQSKMLKGRMAKEKHPLWGTHLSIETKAKLSKTLKERKCSAKENNPNYGKSPKDWMTTKNYEAWVQQKCNRKRMTNGQHQVSVHAEEFTKYIQLGYWFMDKNFKPINI